MGMRSDEDEHPLTYPLKALPNSVTIRVRERAVKHQHRRKPLLRKPGSDNAHVQVAPHVYGLKDSYEHEQVHVRVSI